ncbi:MAG TPA: hypothetical protein PLK28_11130 [Candidatus Rifleibacterium sp.]|nr:hypothetical protein [Candidatus Rifleibacterium sp.]
MIRSFRSFLVVAAMVFSAGLLLGQDITREPLFRVADELLPGILGMRSAEGKVFVANSSGRFVRFDLETGESFSSKTGGEKIVDFDIVLGQMIFLDENGRLGGHILPGWPDRSWDACRVEACDEGVLLAGGDKAFFLGKNATQAVEIDQVDFAMPIPNGFFWSMQIRPEGNWGADLYDCLGNLMSKIYNFSPEFVPAGIELGPPGSEGELLVSSVEEDARKLAFIGNNGRMFWKIDGPEKISPRDVAFDNQGNLLVLEMKGRELWLNRWKMVQPEG